MSLNKIIGPIIAIMILVFILKVAETLNQNFPDFLPGLVDKGARAIRGE